MSNEFKTTHAHFFAIEQDGIQVAGGFAPTEDQVRREANHYALVYRQDGLVRVLIDGQEVFHG